MMYHAFLAQSLTCPPYIVPPSNCSYLQKVKEAQKKQLRKAKQLFRKLTMAAYQAANTNDSSENDGVWNDLEKMNDDVSFLLGDEILFYWVHDAGSDMCFDIFAPSLYLNDN